MNKFTLHICMRLITAWFIMLLSALLSAHASGSVTISVSDTQDQYLIASLNQLKFFATGGFTPSYRPNRSMLKLMETEGFRSMRLVNVEWDNVVKTVKDKVVPVQWSRKLDRELQISKEFGFVPHIIIGQIIPDGLQVNGKGNARRGIKSVRLYKQYLTLFIDHVVNTWGFKNVIWEVGNEMDNYNNNWIPIDKPTVKLDPAGYQSYLRLYRIIADSIDIYRRTHPGVKFLIGGPALTQNSMNYPVDSDRNWITRFAHDVTTENTPCDFISMHFYGSAGTRSEFIDRIKLINNSFYKGQSKPIWITEWGASAFFQHKNENFLPDAGAFGLDFISTAVDSGVANALFIGIARHTDKKKSGPALLNRDGSKTYALKAIEMIKSLEGRRVSCRSTGINVACLATRLPQGGHQVLVWDTSWANTRMGNSRSWLFARSNTDVNINLKVIINNVTVGDTSLKYNDFSMLHF